MRIPPTTRLMASLAPLCRGCAKGGNGRHGIVNAWACFDLNRETGLCVPCAERGGWDFDHVATYDAALYAAAEMMAAEIAGAAGPGITGRVLR